MSLLDRKESIQEISIVSLGIFLAGLIGSIIILVFAFIIGNQTNIFSDFNNAKFGARVETLYPILLSFITLVGLVISSLISYKILGSANSERYKKNIVILGQVAFLQFLIYLFVAPIYLFFGSDNFENIIFTYIFHIVITVFLTNIILDILNNYRYILISFYGNIIGLFISIFIAILSYKIFPEGVLKLISLVFLLPLINFTVIFSKKIFEFSYFHFYRITGSDPIGDIFYKIKKEDEELEKEEAQKNMI